MLVKWVEEATTVASIGGGTYIAAIRDGLRAGSKWATPDEALKIYAGIDFIQRRVLSNNVAHRALPRQECAELAPNQALASELEKLAIELRARFNFGSKKIDRVYGAPITIGGAAWIVA